MISVFHELLASDSYLEWAFLRWVLNAAAYPNLREHITPQRQVTREDNSYRIDYGIEGETERIAIELDGYAFHSSRVAFSADRLRQNDLTTQGWKVIRFTYDAIRSDTARCVMQIQSALAQDALLAAYIIPDPVVETPQMDVDAGHAIALSPWQKERADATYFDCVRPCLNRHTLRVCQLEAYIALGHYYDGGGKNAACVMSVGAGKTALGVLATLAFTRRRALIITPGTVIRGAFDRALDGQAVGNALYGLPGGPLLPGNPAPRSLTLDSSDGPIRSVSREALLAADILVTNFHSLGDEADEGILAKLHPEDIDFIVIDEAHIAASASYQRLFARFPQARRLLLSACFQRHDGKTIEADVVYRYRLIDSIADGNAKNLRIHRFAPQSEETAYEIIWPSGAREEVIGRQALLELLSDERKLAYVVARSEASIQQVMRAARSALDEQATLLHPIKPRMLVSALGERHAAQIARVAEDMGIACDTLHYTMGEARIKSIRARFEQESGDLQGIVQLKMLGQGYDFPPITAVVPLRPYGSFGEFYQFIGRGIRVVPGIEANSQLLDIVCHAEMGLDKHLETIYAENDMDPLLPTSLGEPEESFAGQEIAGDTGGASAASVEARVLFEPGRVEQRVVHDEARIEKRREEREQQALAQRYAAYAKSTANPVPFEKYAQVLRLIRE